MLGVPRKLAEHTLNVDLNARPIKHKAIAAKLHHLEDPEFIKEIKTSTWVSNLVLVPKKNIGVRRVYVDYIGLCKAFLSGCIFWL
jgi:hypothetical protein